MAKYIVVPERSRVLADARSSFHPIRVETPGFEGYLEAEVQGGGEGGLVLLSTPTHIELEVELLSANNALVDGELQKRLEARKFPKIKGDLKEAKPLPGNKSQLSGELSLHGVKRSMQVEVTLKAAPDGSSVEVEGEKTIDMREFGLDPPKFLFFKVDPQVRIKAWLFAKKQA